MRNARLLLAALLVAGAALAACSGNFGAGTTQPGQIIPSGPLNPGSPSPTPNSANGILTYGESDALQQLPTVGGYGGAISLPVPSPKPSGFDNVPIGVTVALVGPTDAPDLNVQVGGKRAKRRERPARPLLYVTLLATRDVTLTTYPRIAIDVPREVVTTYREPELGLAFYNSADKNRTYKLDVARQEAGPAPPSPGAVASGSALPGTPVPTATPSPSATPSAGPSPTPTPSGSPLPPGRSPTPLRNASPSPSPTLPPQRITFAAAPGPLKLSANKAAVFALYALPVASAPSPAASRASSAAPGAAASAAANAEPSVALPAAPSAPVAPGAPAVVSASPRRP
jgi:hypothetical protein